MQDGRAAGLVLSGARIATQDARRSFASAVAIRTGHFVGVEDEALDYRGSRTRVFEVGEETVPERPSTSCASPGRRRGA